MSTMAARVVRMRKIFKGLLIYNGIVIAGSAFAVLFLLETFLLPFLLVPGFFYASGGVILAKKFGGNINHGGVIGLIAWAGLEAIVFVLWSMG